MCRDSVACAYFVAVGFGEVGSVKGEALAVEDDWMHRRGTDNGCRVQALVNILQPV